MVVYADTSFWVATYSPEAESQRALQWMQRSMVPVLFTPLHRVELRNAIRSRVFRQEITIPQRTAAFHEIQSDLDEGILVHAALSWTDSLREAEILGTAHTETLGIRSIDLLHVAAALVLNATDFLSFDARQSKLAKAAGVKVWPNL